MFAFLLCSLISFLTGTAFGTVSTMGIICMITGKALGISPFYLGGAILSGVFFGDRCSPMSSSALLVSELTGTNIYTNIKNMIRTSVIPFIFTVAFYAITGYVSTSSIVSTDSVAIFAQNFNLNPWVILPALIIVILTICKYNIKVTIIWSIISGMFVCSYFQEMSIIEILRCLLVGYHTENPELATLINGGGLISMVKSMAIIAISSSYFGIFRKTKLLDNIKLWSNVIAQHSTNFAAVLIVSIITAALSCNQTLATMLTYEITNNIVSDSEQLAVYLENTVILVSALIPWSVAATFPILTVDAPISCIIYGVYLYSVPLWNLFISYTNIKAFASA
jgi:NhaC family Na+:H+ antiporter